MTKLALFTLLKNLNIPLSEATKYMIKWKQWNDYYNYEIVYYPRNWKKIQPELQLKLSRRLLK